MTFTTGLETQPMLNLAQKVESHPCYGKAAHFRYGRIHVPVARKCNIQCGYCVRKYDCPNENRPGVTTRVVSPAEALVTIRQAVKDEPRMTVLGIAGPFTKHEEALSVVDNHESKYYWGDDWNYYCEARQYPLGFLPNTGSSGYTARNKPEC